MAALPPVWGGSHRQQLLLQTDRATLALQPHCDRHLHHLLGNLLEFPPPSQHLLLALFLQLDPPLLREGLLRAQRLFQQQMIFNTEADWSTLVR